MSRRRALLSPLGLALACAAAGALLHCTLSVDTSGLAGAGMRVPEAGPGTTDAEADAHAEAAAEGGRRPGPPEATYWPVNQHAYLLVLSGAAITWEAARDEALARGGHLATIATQQENEFVFALVKDVPAAYGMGPGGRTGPWLGASQPAGSSEPSGGWAWVTGEPFDYAAWERGQPDNSGGVENALDYYSDGDKGQPTWNDNPTGAGAVVAYVIEFE